MESGTYGYVQLNVGGKIYRTSRATLTRYPDTFFSAMLDGSIPSAKDDQGNYLIDRDGEIFRHVLNYLRCGKLVVPANFVEYALLESEADFFLLQELKLAIAESEGIGLLFDNGMHFNATRKTLLREENSFFTKMFNGDVTVARDSLGNYIMNRDGSYFHHVIRYLREGGIFSPIENHEFDHLKEEAEYFQLKEFAEHLESVKSMQLMAERFDYHSVERAYLEYSFDTHFYFCLCSPSVAYTSYMTTIFVKEYSVGKGASAGVVDLKKITGKKAPTLEDVLSHCTRNFGTNTGQDQLSTNCNKLTYQDGNFPAAFRDELGLFDAL